MKIAIIDYNAANTASIANALERFGFEYVVTRDPKVILSADKVVFPGQGRAGSAMKNLREAGLDEVMRKITKPFLGICLGMQLLFESSEEDGTKCLGIIEGNSKKFREANTKIPQIGWNTVSQTSFSPLFESVPGTFYAYFVNSYYVETGKLVVLGNTRYGGTVFPSLVRKDNFYGIQFHPEKSGDAGLQLLKNFCELGTPKRQETLVIPAIDLMDGTCVRLRQGDYDDRKVYSNNPASVARSFVKDGAKYIHVVDLDGARQGKPANTVSVMSIAKEVDVPVQVGGGIRTFEQAKGYLDAGIERIIVGTSAIKNPAMVKKLIAEYGPGRIVVSVDAKGGFAATEGWQNISSEPVDPFLTKLADLGVTTIIYTDTEKDGTLKGPDYARVAGVLQKPLRVIVAGGIGSVDHIQKLNGMGAYGVIVGKALYEKTVDLKEALRAVPALKIVRETVRPAEGVTKRIIACMDIAGGRVVKGTNFTDLQDAGDPVGLGRRYSDEGADELVFLDIAATVEGRETLYALVRDIAKEVTVPFTVGGGVRTLEDIKRLLNAGADKVSIGSAAIQNPDLVTRAAQEFGSQCIVISVDPKRKGDSWEVYSKGGREESGIDAIAFVKDMAKRGAGELL
ncbi:MAG: 1-(5-phosphoribosyl)-5-[(5-phosphoribosylamino)methylideneamino]imidazole-4-carboxamide isomerase, partial [Patescibacteria group bacterium]